MHPGRWVRLRCAVGVMTEGAVSVPVVLRGALGSTSRSVARREYDHQVHAALLRTVRAVLQIQRVLHTAEHPLLPQVTEQLCWIEQQVAELPDHLDDRPMLALAQRLGLRTPETEKQLAKAFDAAEAGHVLLLFDEADALFGQRSTEMRGATDRYANLEVNFLLQRIERFNGIVILTTNLDASIDKALKRRLAAHVVFQHPDDEERTRLWRQMLAADGAPLARDIDPDQLSHAFPKMTGANIRNAALAAAFLAAAEASCW